MASFVDPIQDARDTVQQQQDVIAGIQTELLNVETRLRQGYEFNGKSENEINNKIQEIKQAGESFESTNATEIQFKTTYQELSVALGELERLQTTLNDLIANNELLGDASLDIFFFEY